MRPTDNLSKSFKELHVRTSTRLDESVYSEISRAAEKQRIENRIGLRWEYLV